MQTTHSNHFHPTWYDEKKHGSAWERVKEAMKRDWEQTKADFKAGGQELNQNVADTVKQATGNEAIPPEGQPNWEKVENAHEYGYTARQQFGDKFKAWDDNLDRELSTEWSKNDKNTKWDDVRPHVRRGYDYNP